MIDDLFSQMVRETFLDKKVEYDFLLIRFKVDNHE
jgi:hypothetical protein